MKTFEKPHQQQPFYKGKSAAQLDPGAPAALQGHGRIVSSPDERLILVDRDDQPLGEADKLNCHLGEGRLHRAFSLHVINSKRELLLQCRSEKKMLWPGFWSNSCCSHPRAGETIEDAVHRRAHEELGLSLEVEYLYKFQYKARYLNIGTENELCSVFVGYSDDHPIPNPDELSDWRYLTIDELDRRLASAPGHYTPWFRMEWARIRSDFLQIFEQYQ